MGIFLVVISGIVAALFSLGYKLNASRPTRTNELLIMMGAVGSLLSVACMALFGEWTLPAAALYAGIPQGIASFVAVDMFFSVTRRSRLNISWTIIQFYVVVPLFASLLIFHDDFTLRGAAGVIMILASIPLFGRKPREGTTVGGRPDARTLALLLMAAFFSGVANTMPKVYTSVAAEHPIFPLVLVINLAFSLAAAAVSIARLIWKVPRVHPATIPVAAAANAQPVDSSSLQDSGKRTEQRRMDSLIGAAIATWMGLWQVAAAALLVVGLTLLPGTVAYPVRVVSNIVGVVVLARLVFREGMSRPEWLGTAIAIAGVALVASSS